MIPDFHDGFVDGVIVSGRQAKIFLRMLDGQKFTLQLQEVERLHVENFREGNIIFGVDMLEPEQLTAEQIGEAYQYSAHDQQGFVMGDWIEKARQRGLKTIEISASYGCSALMVFGNFELREGYVFD
jgi:hypothetical protein